MHSGPKYSAAVMLPVLKSLSTHAFTTELLSAVANNWPDCSNIALDI